ncbi:MAG: hypothetical protein FWB74_07505, partial [Defluviitaleaceae bacterium]|nr:hypothetical protein [Defluviitaleaceae bacterium]
LDDCADCAEDFEAYSTMMQGFTAMEMEIVEAPEGFAPAVMAKVAALDLYAPKKSKKAKVLDSLILLPFALLVVVIFGGTALAVFGNGILSWAYGAGLYEIYAVLTPGVELTASILTSIGDFFARLGGVSHTALVVYGASFLVIFAALVALQISINTPSKMRAVAKERVK